LPIRWWIAGGWALDPEGRFPHSDIDVAVLRPEHEALREYLADWDLHVAFKGALRPWRGGPVAPSENAIWARPSADHPWHIDFKIEAVDGDQWLYRRDPTIRVPIADLGMIVEGIPFLAPGVAQLYSDGSTIPEAPSSFEQRRAALRSTQRRREKQRWRTSSASSMTIR
jgi:hypothetical protein